MFEYIETTRLCLPRNLSYAEESYLDSFSVSADFVQAPKRIAFNALKGAHDYRAGLDSTDDTVLMAESLDPLLLHKFESCHVNDDGSKPALATSGTDIMGKVKSCPLAWRSDVYADQIDGSKRSDQSTVSDWPDSSNDIEDYLDDYRSPDENDSEPVSRHSGLSFKNELENYRSRPSPDLPPILIDLPNKTHSDLSSQSDCDSGYKDIYESPLYTDKEFNFSRAELRKSTSLKTNKTPPGTPRRKKAVRFADAMGLDLEYVRHILNLEAPPKIPSSALAVLNKGLALEQKEHAQKYLHICFDQPGASSSFLQKVVTNKVCLENAIVTGITITGFIRVANVGYHKTVRIRYTKDDWQSFHDIAATYVANSCDGPTDRFSFRISAPDDFPVGAQIQCAVSFVIADNTHWDNNGEENYRFHCRARTLPIEYDTSWINFI